MTRLISETEIQMCERSHISELEVFTAEDDASAKLLGFVITGTPGECINRAVILQNSATSLTLEAGYLLLKTKSETGHGEFGKYLKAHDMERERAADLMRNAKFYTSL